MKIVVIISCLFILLIGACQTQSPSNSQQQEIDSLKSVINQLKPGLGEVMTQFEYHHDRLSGAIGQHDFERASYEVDEIKEAAEKIMQLHITNDKLQQPFSFFFEKYLKNSLDILADNATKKDTAALRSNFVALTNNCNGCHHENNMSFMKIN
ncbi:MAG: hypothetical protein C5B59_11905 [Bacteroidetes bacterium]|nr:MAG: hypothetical protein C5B59_11905 [Bacteroidota bacterium]